MWAWVKNWRNTSVLAVLLLIVQLKLAIQMKYLHLVAKILYRISELTKTSNILISEKRQQGPEI